MAKREPSRLSNLKDYSQREFFSIVVLELKETMRDVMYQWVTALNRDSSDICKMWEYLLMILSDKRKEEFLKLFLLILEERELAQSLDIQMIKT